MSSKVSVAYEDETALIQYEDVDDKRFIHFDAKKFSHSIVRHYRKAFQTVKENCRKEGYSQIYSYTRNRKFAELVSPDFEKEMIIEVAGKNYEVLKWVLKP